MRLIKADKKGGEKRRLKEGEKRTGQYRGGRSYSSQPAPAAQTAEASSQPVPAEQTTTDIWGYCRLGRQLTSPLCSDQKCKGKLFAVPAAARGGQGVRENKLGGHSVVGDRRYIVGDPALTATLPPPPAAAAGRAAGRRAAGRAAV